MMRRTVIAVAAVIGILGAGAAPAQAVIGPGPQLIVLNYYDSGGELVGQKWWGCPGQSPGQWGQVTSNHNVHFVPC